MHGYLLTVRGGTIFQMFMLFGCPSVVSLSVDGKRKSSTATSKAINTRGSLVILDQGWRDAKICVCRCINIDPIRYPKRRA